MEKPTHVSSTEIKNRFGYYLKQALRKRQPVVIEHHGKPTAVLVRMEDWEAAQRPRARAATWYDKILALREELPPQQTDSVTLLRELRDERS